MELKLCISHITASKLLNIILALSSLQTVTLHLDDNVSFLSYHYSMAAFCGMGVVISDATQEEFTQVVAWRPPRIIARSYFRRAAPC